MDEAYMTREDLLVKFNVQKGRYSAFAGTLTTLGILEVTKKGFPSKNYFHVNKGVLEEYLNYFYNKPCKLRDFFDEQFQKVPVEVRESMERYRKLYADNKAKKPVVKQEKAKIEKKEYPKSDIVEYWNCFKEKYGTPAFRNRSSNVYLMTLQKIAELKNGAFFSKNAVENKIPPDLANKKWSNNDIKETLDECVKMWMGGFSPQDKTSLPKSLYALFYNPSNKFSRFIDVHLNGAKELKSIVDDRKYDAAPESVKDRYEELYPIFDPEQKQKAKWYKAMIEFRDEIEDEEEERRDPKVKYKYTKGYSGTSGVVIYSYTSWLIREYTGDEKRFVSPNAFTADSKLWLRFLDENYG